MRRWRAFLGGVIAAALLVVAEADVAELRATDEAGFDIRHAHPRTEEVGAQGVANRAAGVIPNAGLHGILQAHSADDEHIAAQ